MFGSQSQSFTKNDDCLLEVLAQHPKANISLFVYAAFDDHRSRGNIFDIISGQYNEMYFQN